MKRTVNLSMFIRIPELVSMVYWSLIYFRRPDLLWKSYILQTKPLNNFYDLRNGFRLYLSDNPHDSITVMVIFCRKEYGNIKRGSTVLDIGANIGVFTLFALMQGAEKIVAVEPNMRSFEILRHNLLYNNLSEKVVTLDRAVGKIDNEIVYLPIDSSPYNEALKSGSSEDYQKSTTITLNTLVGTHVAQNLDLLKIDCEGAEYDFLYNAPSNLLYGISQIKMEVHGSKVEREGMIKFLKQHGFRLVKGVHMIRWFTRP